MFSNIFQQNIHDWKFSENCLKEMIFQESILIDIH